MDETISKVYIKIDGKNRIIAIEGGYTMGNIQDIENWILVDQGTGDAYNLCQTNYLPKPLLDENGAFQFKYIGGIIERTIEEKEEDVKSENKTKTTEERIGDIENRLKETETAFEALITGRAE